MKLLCIKGKVGGVCSQPFYLRKFDGEGEVVFTGVYHEARWYEDSEVEATRTELVSLGFPVEVISLRYIDYYESRYGMPFHGGTIKGRYLWIWLSLGTGFVCEGKVSKISYGVDENKCELIVEGSPVCHCTYEALFELSRHRVASCVYGSQNASMKVTEGYCEWVLHRDNRYVVKVDGDGIIYGSKESARHFFSEEEASRVVGNATRLVGVSDLAVEVVWMPYPGKGGVR